MRRVAPGHAALRELERLQRRVVAEHLCQQRSVTIVHATPRQRERGRAARPVDDVQLGRRQRQRAQPAARADGAAELNGRGLGRRRRRHRFGERFARREPPFHPLERRRRVEHRLSELHLGAPNARVVADVPPPLTRRRQILIAGRWDGVEPQVLADVYECVVRLRGELREQQAQPDAERGADVGGRRAHVTEAAVRRESLAGVEQRLLEQR